MSRQQPSKETISRVLHKAVGRASWTELKTRLFLIGAEYTESCSGGRHLRVAGCFTVLDGAYNNYLILRDED